MPAELGLHGSKVRDSDDNFKDSGVNELSEWRGL